jgi:cobalt-precorrin 5A hydrolase
MVRTAVVVITRHGIEIARKIKQKIPEVEIYAQAKHSDSGLDVNWFTDPSAKIMGDLFKTFDALICIFSLGAVIRLIAPHLVDKKSDPAILVIDDKGKYVISALSGHIGGGNALARLVATSLNAEPIITTAADVHETIAVDLLGREFGWVIDNFQNVTRVSAFMVNEDKIAIYQDAGQQGWWKAPLPKNVSIVSELDEIKSPEFSGGLVITDRILTDQVILEKSVVYRPKSLVVGIGIHWDTNRDEIELGIERVFQQNQLSIKSIRNISSIDRGSKVKGLDEYSSSHEIPVEIYGKEELAKVVVPNPSPTVQKFEGTPSVSEASSLLSSKGALIVPKQKFPPNLTVAVSRISFPQR